MIIDQHRSYYLQGLKEHDNVGKDRLLETFHAGQDYTEQFIEKIGFEGEINHRVES